MFMLGTIAALALHCQVSDNNLSCFSDSGRRRSFRCLSDWYQAEIILCMNIRVVCSYPTPHFMLKLSEVVSCRNHRSSAEFHTGV
jgi:hypothetical protein